MTNTGSSATIVRVAGTGHATIYASAQAPDSPEARVERIKKTIKAWRDESKTKQRFAEAANSASPRGARLLQRAEDFEWLMEQAGFSVK